MIGYTPKYKVGDRINCRNCRGTILKEHGYIFPLGCTEYTIEMRLSEKMLLRLMELKQDDLYGR